jgi:hypothetical protein
MKPPLLAALALLVIASPVSAQSVRCDTFADMTNCTGPGGYTAREMTCGSVTNGRDSMGNSWRTDRFGDTTTTQVTPGVRQRGW